MVCDQYLKIYIYVKTHRNTIKSEFQSTT